MTRLGAATARTAVVVSACVSVSALAAAQDLSQPRAPGEDAPVEVVICESHHEVLRHWLRAVRDGRLPSSGLEVVHVDAHPDLAPPRAFVPAGVDQDVPALLRAVDIASFQLAAVRMGLVERIVWLRPDFAGQLPDGQHRFQLGIGPGNRLRVDARHDYYVLDEGWAPFESLREAVPVRLRVLPLSASASAGSLASGAAVLDIDLDVFATRNPAADALRRMGLSSTQLDALRRIFARDRLVLAEDPATRIQELEGLLESIRTLAEEPSSAWPGAVVTLWRRGLGPLDLWELYRILGHVPADAAVDGLLEHGRQLVGSPEHPSITPDEIEDRARRIGDLVRRGAVRPRLVTIARSVEDGFTPREAWPRIEWAVLRQLSETLQGATVRLDVASGPAPRPP